MQRLPLAAGAAVSCTPAAAVLLPPLPGAAAATPHLKLVPDGAAKERVAALPHVHKPLLVARLVLETAW